MFTPAALPPSKLRQRSFSSVVVLLLCGLAGLYHLHTINRDFPSRRSDLQPVKIGIQATLQRHDPYSAEVTQQIQRAYYGHTIAPSDQTNQMAYVYPPHTAVVLAFLAPFQWETSRHIFLVLALLLTLVAVPVWIQVCGMQWGASSTFLAILGVMASWPTLWALRLQQPTLLVAALIAVACLLIRKGRDVEAALLLALATIKPQLIAILTLWLLVRAVSLRRPRFLIVFTAATLLLLGIGTYLIPNGLSQWILAGTNLAHTDQRSTFTLILGDWPGRVANLVFAAIVALYLWSLRKSKAGSPEFAAAISLALAATLTLMPTGLSMIYNQILLVPGCFVLMQSRPDRQNSGWVARLEELARGLVYAFIGWGFLAQVMAAIGESLTGPLKFWRALPFENLLLPPTVATALLLSGFIARDEQIRSRKPRESFREPEPSMAIPKL